MVPSPLVRKLWLVRVVRKILICRSLAVRVHMLPDHVRQSCRWRCDCATRMATSNAKLPT